MFTRYGIGLAAGAVVTVILLYIMQAVIAIDKNPLNEAPKIRIMDFVRLIEDVPIETKQREMEPPPPVEDLPPDPPKVVSDSTMGAEVVDWDFEAPDLGLNDLGGGTWSQDGEYMPWFKPEPEYPTIALQRGIEGYVIVQFDVTEEGTVENPVVLEAKPPSMFDRSAIRAALKFKYKPKILNGQPVRVSGVKNIIYYELEEQ
ncbi:MAG: energy transducer TonB [Gammaproteobacteria bacterium]|nr:energy transducer TonB [Gammaproteobacteria bacterium]MXW07368.1 energy transducer TonB [Gammaproteobacteria bacterium]MYC25768.1 energy transducer TonB [Gammaproteobacteria bacterium]